MQQQHFFSVAGLNPNLLLIAFLIIVFNNVFDFKVIFLFFFLFLTAVFFVNPFYFSSMAILTVLVIGFGLMKQYLTGQKIIDFAIALSLIQILFYVLINVRNLNFLSPLNLFWELIYNLILGLIVFGIYEKIRY